MIRQFLQLYLLIVLTLAAASWMQDWLWATYGRQGAEVAFQDRGHAAALAIVAEQLRMAPRADREQLLRDIGQRTRIDLELLEPADIAGQEMLERLARGEATVLEGSNGTWMLRGLEDEDRVIAFRYAAPDAQRSALDWALAFLFYAAIALVIMIWLWPLTRDLRRLEQATMSFGNRNWMFDADVRAGSPIHRLAQAFRRMAARIDGLITSHKDMSNAVAHELKTPLARMRFEVEMARGAADRPGLLEHLDNINTDITELNGFITAALDYAILERAEVAPNMAEHDFTVILPALTESVARSAPGDVQIRCNVARDSTRVSCDAHLMETVLRNLLYNAMRYARKEIQVTFGAAHGYYSLRVEDDGPGIPEADRQRVFDSFVQLGERTRHKTSYGLGLAIVKRAVEWHNGEVAVSQSTLGGAAFALRWPATQPT